MSAHSLTAALCIMFVLVEMVDTVRIPPWNFQRQLNDAIAEELNKKLANKVCVCERGEREERESGKENAR